MCNRAVPTKQMTLTCSELVAEPAATISVSSTGYLFDDLPKPPQEVVNGGVSFNWATMTESRFVDIVLKFGDYWETRGKDEDTWGLFSVLGLDHSSGGEFGVSIQFCNPDGTLPRFERRQRISGSLSGLQSDSTALRDSP